MLRSALRADTPAYAPTFMPSDATATEAANRLVERYGEGQEPRKSAAELDRLVDRLRFVRFDWDKVSPADRLEVAWVLWSGAQPAAEHGAFLYKFLDWMDAPNHRYQAARLAIVWAAAFDRRLPSIRIVGDWLASHLTWLPDTWHRLADQYQLFAIDPAPNALAEAFLGVETTAARYFQALRLPAKAARGGLGTEMLAAAVAQVAPRGAEEPALLLRLCDLAGEVGVFELTAEPRVAGRRTALHAPLAEALLLPWAGQTPPSDVKTTGLTFLLRHYGDGRVAPKRWRAMCDSARAVMHRWLTQETVATYFRLASRNKAIDRTRLAERRQFWISRLDDVDGAWLLAGADDAARLDGDHVAHGRLGGRPDQTALLLRIGDLTVLEIAREASERIWLADNPLAPSLYQRPDQIYWPGALAHGADFSSAYGDESPLAWQRRLAAFLERQEPREYQADRTATRS